MARRRRARGRGRGRGQEGKFSTLPEEGLLPRSDLKIVKKSSESSDNGKVATNAIDGDPRTIWHTRWQGDLAKHPHELSLDDLALGGKGGEERRHRAATHR